MGSGVQRVKQFLQEVLAKLKNLKIPQLVKSKKFAAYAAIVLILIVGAIVFRYIGPWAEKSNDASAGGKITVEVRQAEVMKVRPASTYDATLLAGEEGIVGADVPGKVVRIMFKEGDAVKKGAPLIALDNRDMLDQLEAAKAQLSAVSASLPKAEANVEISRRNYNNARALLEAGAVSPNDVSDAEAALRVAEADLNALKANIAAAQSGVNRLQHNLDNMVIKAPIDGIVEDKNVTVGAYVTPGVPLAMVKNTAVIQAVIKIAQEDVGKVRLGQKAEISVSGDSRIYEGTVSFISTAASTASRNFTVKVEVPNPDNKLKPGLYAKVSILGSGEASVLVIPLQAAMSEAGNYYVLINDNGVARRQTVTLGETYGDLIEVKSGLKVGDGVICTNINSLRDGDLIEAAEPPEASGQQAATESPEAAGQPDATAGQGE